MSTTVSRQMISRLDQAVTLKMVNDSVYKDLTKYFSPFLDDNSSNYSQSPFNFGNVSMSTKRPRTTLYNTEGANAAENLVSTISTGLINYAADWFKFTSYDPRIQGDVMARRFLEQATEVVSSAVNATEANFYSSAQEFLSDLVIYGTATMYVEEDESKDGVVYCTYPFQEMYIAENHLKKIDTIFRIFKMTAAQITLRWPEAIPDRVKNVLKTNPEEMFDIVHAVTERKMGKAYNLPIKTKKNYASFFFMRDSHEILSEGGYDEMPYVVARWSKRTGEVYGRSPAWTALPDVKRANAIEKTILESAEKIGNPPLLMADDGVITQLRIVPGQPIVGGLDSMTGRQRLVPLNSGSNLPAMDAILSKIEMGIRERFFVGTLTNYSPGVEKTATEINEFRREESRIMGPQIGKIQNEFLRPVVERTRNILLRQRKFPTIPEQLNDVNVDLEYTSPLAHMQRYSDIQAINQTVQAVLPFLQTDPSLIDNFNADKVFQHVAEVSGVPASIIRSPAEVAELRAQRDAQANALASAQSLNQLGGAAAGFAKASDIIGQ